jgi:hypothetical protein
MKTLKTQNTNIVHHEKIHNISFVTNIKFFLYFEFKQGENSHIYLIAMDQQVWFLFLIFDYNLWLVFLSHTNSKSDDSFF